MKHYRDPYPAIRTPHTQKPNPMKKFILLITVVQFLFSSPLASQTEWQKYEGNPVLEPGPPGQARDHWLCLLKSIIFKSEARNPKNETISNDQN